DSKLSQIIQLLELASSKKAKLESLVNSLLAYFSRTVLLIAFICFAFWFFYKEESFEISLVNAIAVLIIACPCALALATPVSNLVALGRALKKHILFKSSSVIEDLSKCDCVVFDKTGILTKIELELKEVFLDKALDLNELYNFVKLSKHPISQN
ncbi:TPA: HAD-IC family P-type ATPase, partial [Campylobacter jejuni]|nr:HAD-IC family P-type ATPase [Campylobacter jejuni]